MRSAAYMVAAAAVLAIPAVAAAQQTEAQRATTVSVSGGFMNYDLQAGEGTAPMTALRVTVPFGRVFTAELGALAAWPEQGFPAGVVNTLDGDRALFLVAPEAQLQVAFPAGRIAPYLGVGGGVAIDRAEREAGVTSTDFSASAAGGVRLALADRLGGLAEVRLRGIGTDLDARTAEFTVGLSWQLKPTRHVF
jgi:hypothetical protein